MGDSNRSVLAIATQDLRVDYGDFTAVHGLTLEIGKGEIYGLVGPNGAGKTSTIRALATLLEPTYGEIRIEGRDIRQERRDVHRVLGYMPDLAPANPEMKVWEFLDMFAAAYGYGEPARSDRWRSCLEMVRLSDQRDTLCGSLSRGMLQRLILAKTLIPEPRVLLLDEPASGMDPMARINLRNILRQLASERATTVLISSHILSELADMCSSVGIMSRGRLIMSGDVNAIASAVKSTTREVQLEWTEEFDAASFDFRLIYSREDVSGFSLHPRTASFDFSGEDEALHAVLRQLIEAGLPLVRFAPRKSSIEDVLMQIEHGESESDGKRT